MTPDLPAFLKVEVQPFTITEGAEYIYQLNYPPGRRGKRYRVVGFATLVPCYQQVVIELGVTGPDRGKLFVCSLQNFASHFQPVPVAEPEPAPEVPEKIISYKSEGTGV